MSFSDYAQNLLGYLEKYKEFLKDGDLQFFNAGIELVETTNTFQQKQKTLNHNQLIVMLKKIINLLRLFKTRGMELLEKETDMVILACYKKNATEQDEEDCNNIKRARRDTFNILMETFGCTGIVSYISDLITKVKPSIIKADASYKKTIGEIEDACLFLRQGNLQRNYTEI